MSRGKDLQDDGTGDDGVVGRNCGVLGQDDVDLALDGGWDLLDHQIGAVDGDGHDELFPKRRCQRRER